MMLGLNDAAARKENENIAHIEHDVSEMVDITVKKDFTHICYFAIHLNFCCTVLFLLILHSSLNALFRPYGTSAILLPHVVGAHNHCAAKSPKQSLLTYICIYTYLHFNSIWKWNLIWFLSLKFVSLKYWEIYIVPHVYHFW